MKINKNHLEFVYDSDTTIKFGKYGWKGEEIDKIWYLAWKPEHNPYSNDENSQSRLIGYVSFYNDNSFIAYSYLKNQYRGKGLGFYMYTGVAKREGFLSTNLNSASLLASTLWEKLKDKYASRKLYLEDQAQGYRIYG